MTQPDSKRVLPRRTRFEYRYARHQFRLEDVCYFEAVDKRVFAYTTGEVYELRSRLYQLEAAYAERLFIRCSKSILLNLMQLDSIAPALNSRFKARLKNGEQLIISRQYAPAVVRAVTRGE